MNPEHVLGELWAHQIQVGSVLVAVFFYAFGFMTGRITKSAA
jgi:hypothetical protein